METFKLETSKETINVGNEKSTSTKCIFDKIHLIIQERLLLDCWFHKEKRNRRLENFSRKMEEPQIFYVYSRNVLPTKKVQKMFYGLFRFVFLFSDSLKIIEVLINSSDNHDIEAHHLRIQLPFTKHSDQELQRQHITTIGWIPILYEPHEVIRSGNQCYNIRPIVIFKRKTSHYFWKCFIDLIITD